MEKIKLADAKLKDLRVEKSNIEVPTYIEVISARLAKRYDENGQMIDNSAAKIVLNVVDSVLAQTLKEKGLSLTQVIPVTLEVEGEESELLSLKTKSIVQKKFNIQAAKLAFKWVKFGDQGGYSGLKLVINLKELVPAKEN